MKFIFGDNNDNTWKASFYEYLNVISIFEQEICIERKLEHSQAELVIKISYNSENDLWKQFLW